MQVREDNQHLTIAPVDEGYSFAAEVCDEDGNILAIIKGEEDKKSAYDPEFRQEIKDMLPEVLDHSGVVIILWNPGSDKAEEEKIII